MEYIILIVVLAVLVLGGGGTLLFTRSRRGAGTYVPTPPGPAGAPPKTAAPGTAAPGTAAPGTAAPGTAAPGTTAPEGAAPGTAAPDTAAGAEAPVTIEKPPPSAGRMRRLRARLARSQSTFGGALLSLLSRDRLDDDTWDEVEEVLITADVGVGSARQIVEDLKTKVRVEGTRTPDELRALLRDELLGQVGMDTDRGLHMENKPAVIMMVGVNGTGKTTTAGKLARSLVGDGKKVVLGAADTFRAAAADQLQTWGERVGASTVRSEKDGADPASVAFDAVSKGIDGDADVVLIDTAGRLHTKTGLMDELGKVKRVVEKKAPVDEVILVLDATTGQNGMRQARVFAEVVNISGIALTKLDGTAKGGIVIAVQRELGVPVKLVGLGEGPDDLAPFDPETFVDAILG
jgi:fused signal recognition particle receptor